MITILHTNDFHNSLTQEQASKLKRARVALGDRGLLVDAGDAVGSGNLSYRPSGEPILKSMSDIGYDVMTVGNREFHLTRRGFHCKVGLARFPVLSANVRVRSAIDTAGDPYILEETTCHGDIECIAGRLVAAASAEERKGRYSGDSPVVDFVVRTVQSGNRPVTVVVFGLTVPMITEKMVERHISHYLFAQAVATAHRIVPLLRQQYRPDVTIALTHIGITQDRLLASSVKGIDLIVGGHSHTVLPSGEWVGETLIVQAGSHGRFVGRVDMTLDRTEGVVSQPGSHERLSIRATLLDLNSSLELADDLHLNRKLQ